jgi:hypothetical protein
MRTSLFKVPACFLATCLAIAGVAVGADGKATRPAPASLLKVSPGVARDGMLSFHPVELEPGAIQAAAVTGGLLVFPDPEGGLLSYQHVSDVDHGNGVMTWIGRAEGAAIGQEAVFTIGPDAAFGRAPRADGSLVFLETVAGRTRLMLDQAEQLGESSELQVHDVLHPPVAALEAAGKARLAAAAQPDTLQSDHAVLDVMLAYSQGLVDYVGSEQAVRTLLQNRIDLGNQALANGGVTGRFRLVATVRVDVSDNGSNSDMLRMITNWKDATAHPLALHLAMLRHRHGADIVGLVRRFIKSESVSCGNGWVGAYKGSSIANSVDYGYFTANHGTNDGSFCSDRTIAHEIGHNLGQNHDIDSSDNERDGAHTYSHGYRVTPPGENGFYTVMAYRDGQQAQALTFSNPNVTRADCSNLPCGVAEADVARSLNITLPGAANWIHPADSNTRHVIGSRGHLYVTLDGLPALTNARWRVEHVGTGKLTASGPTVAAAGATLTARVAWDALPVPASTPLAVRLVVESSPGVVAGFRDLQLVRRDWQGSARALGNNRPITVAVPAWNRTVEENRLYFAVPPHAASVRVRVTSAVDVDVYANRAANLAPRAPLVGPGTARTAPVASDTGPALTKEIEIPNPVGFGNAQLMITLARPASGTLNYQPATVTAWVSSQRVMAPFRSGQYFNPDRAGHGVFVDFSGDQWVAVWYTYFEDGTPTWYYAQGPSPGPNDAGIWSAPLLRIGWNGSATHATEVGEIVITPLGANSMVFSYNLDGDSGSEELSRLGGGGCPTSQGAPLDATGHWYSPSLPGFGYSAQFEPDLEIYTAYAYDAAGVARWLIGAKPWNEAVTQVNMEQIAGTCPTCGHAPTTSRLTGTLTRTLGTNADGKRGLTQINLQAPFLSPLGGSWNQSRATALLVARKDCL